MDRTYPAIALIKFFSELDHYEAFIAGSLLCRPPHYFRTRDEPGRGDPTESCFGFWSKSLGHELPNIMCDGKALDLGNAVSVFIHSHDEPTDAYLQCWSVIGSQNGFENSLAQMIKEFGPYFVVLPTDNLNEYVCRIERKLGVSVRHGAVEYSDDAFRRSLIVKNTSFEYQKEYRFLIGECNKEDTKERTYEVGALSDLFTDCKSLKMSASSGEVVYCTFGCRDIVIVQ